MPLHARVLGVTCAAAAVLVVSGCGSNHSAHTNGRPTTSASSAATGPAAAYPEVRQVLNRLTTADGAPGALAAVGDASGPTVLTSGVADTTTHAPMPGEARFRIGSVTKTFTATIVLQLVGEHKVALDAPLEQYLPGLIRGNGNDGHLITVRQILQHTSGLPDYLTYLSPPQIIKDPLAHHDPQQMVRIALAHPREFAPGTHWKYSNTNYLVAGMLIEKVTGHPYAQEIHQRIIQPLGLHDTSFPGDDPNLPDPHPHGYVKPGNAGLVDLTRFNPTAAHFAGGVVSSGPDLDRFFAALLDGRLLHPAELRAMMTTRPTGDPSGRAYGLGLESRPLPCGGQSWGHDGDILGFETMVAATTSGRQATAMTNLDPGGSDAQDTDMRAVVTSALCAAAPTGPAH